MNRRKTVKKPTIDLQPGDVVVWGQDGSGHTSTVVKVERRGGVVLRVLVEGMERYFDAGDQSVQNVLERK